MNGPQYEDKIRRTPLRRDEDGAPDEATDDCRFAAAIFRRGCGIQFPAGDCAAVQATLQGHNHFSHWISLGGHFAEAQERADGGTPVIAVSANALAVVTPRGGRTLGPRITRIEDVRVSCAGDPQPAYGVTLGACWPAAALAHTSFYFYDPEHGL